MKLLPRAATFVAVTFCAGALANAATLDLTTAPQGAPAQVNNLQDHHVVPAPQIQAAPISQIQTGEIVQPLPEAAVQEDQDFATLSAAVAAQTSPAQSDEELNCLAAGIYYESKGEPLAGQLAVADVIINRTKSGRFPKSVCGVLTQRGQFSFVRGGKIPTPPSNAQYRRALAIAQIAQKDLFDSPAEDALYFHARYVKGGGGRDRIVTVGNHIFYR